MIKNYVIRAKVDSLLKQRTELVSQKDALAAAIKSTGITKGAAYQAAHKCDPSLLEARNRLTSQYMEVEKKLGEIKGKLRELASEEEAEKNQVLIRIFKEIFTPDQLTEINNEARRRLRGEHPFKLDFNIQGGITAKEQVKKYKALSREYIDKVMEYRIMLTEIIEKGCNVYGNDFLRFVSPLNRAVLPLKELEKVKQKHLIH